MLIIWLRLSILDEIWWEEAAEYLSTETVIWAFSSIVSILESLWWDFELDFNYFEEEIWDDLQSEESEREEEDEDEEELSLEG